MRKWLVTPMVFLPLLNKRACLARLVITVAFKVHIWVKWMITLLVMCMTPSRAVKNYPGGVNFAGKYQFDFSMIYDSSVWYLQ